ncbi:hypothetical protein B0H19DRAFT_1073668 [Mycena capillaripes]|nr:hypothetical protein B0H19DRAFT_1073668 [Mycena capillaripes]
MKLFATLVLFIAPALALALPAITPAGANHMRSMTDEERRNCGLPCAYKCANYWRNIPNFEQRVTKSAPHRLRALVVTCPPGPWVSQGALIPCTPCLLYPIPFISAASRKVNAKSGGNPDSRALQSAMTAEIRHNRIVSYCAADTPLVQSLLASSKNQVPSEAEPIIATRQAMIALHRPGT